MKNYKEQLQNQRKELEIKEEICDILDYLTRQKENHYMHEEWDENNELCNLIPPEEDDWRYNTYMAHSKVIEAIEKLLK